MAMSALPSMVSQVAQHAGEVHFRVPGLEAALDRGLDPALGLGLAQALAEEVDQVSARSRSSRPSEKSGARAVARAPKCSLICSQRYWG
jgi:hypothetical protein